MFEEQKLAVLPSPAVAPYANRLSRLAQRAAAELRDYGLGSFLRGLFYVAGSVIGKQSFTAKLPWGKLSVPGNRKKLGIGGLIYARRGMYERHLQRYFRSCHGSFIDVGANLGYWTRFVLSCSAKSPATIPTITAFEPSESTFAFLRSNIERVKSGAGPEIRLESQALGDQEATVYLCASNDDPGSTFVGVRGDAAVQQITLDTYVQAHAIQHIGLIKIDVEGYEYDVLSGSRATVSSMRPTIICELINAYLQRNGHAPSEVINLMLAVGYKAFYICPNGDEVLCERFVDDGDYLFAPSELASK